MFCVKIICVGKNKEKFYQQAFDEYVKRLTPYCRIEFIEIPEHRLTEKPSQTEIANALSKEAEIIKKHLSNESIVISLCVEGKKYSSTELASYINECKVSGISKICFIIGGSFGIDENLKEYSDIRLSMSNMTFPHHLARVMLIEQIYRSFKIIEGSNYHK